MIVQFIIQGGLADARQAFDKAFLLDLFNRMAVFNMADFMGDDGGQFIFMIDIALQPGIDGNLATRQGPGIDPVVGDYRQLPG